MGKDIKSIFYHKTFQKKCVLSKRNVGGNLLTQNIISVVGQQAAGSTNPKYTYHSKKPKINIIMQHNNRFVTVVMQLLHNYYLVYVI